MKAILTFSVLNNESIKKAKAITQRGTRKKVEKRMEKIISPTFPNKKSEGNR